MPGKFSLKRVAADPAYAFLILGVLVLQAGLVSVTFPVSELLTDTPFLYIDAPYHWYEAEIAKGLAAEGRLVGYDPYFGAGHVGGIIFNASGKFPAALSILLEPWLSTVQVYKLYCFAAAVLGPAGVPLAARWLRVPRLAGFAATLFAFLLWWCSALRWFHTAGMVSFVLASCVALPYASLVVRSLCRPISWPTFALLAVVGTIAIFLHPLFPLLVGPLILALTIVYWREFERRALFLHYTALPLLCAAPNLIWLLPTLQYPGLADASQPYQQAVNVSIIWNEALGRITDDARGSRLNALLWLATLFGVWLKSDAKRLAVGIALVAIGLIVFAALGAALPFVGALQPNRFSSAAYLFICIPAGLGAAALADRVLSDRRGWMIKAGLALFVTASSIWFARELAREISSADVPHHGARPPEVRGLGPISTWIIDWLKTQTSTEARVLFETSKSRIHDQAHMAGYYALTSNREFIGGPYPYMNFAGFWDGFLFGRPIESFSPEEFSGYLSRYNIGWIVAFSEETKRFIEHVPGIAPLERFGAIQTYRVSGTHDFFLEGSGKVTVRSINRLELDQLSGPSVVLKYHYTSGLSSTPPVRIEPAVIADNPVPFIRLVSPPPHVVLQMK